MTDVRNDFDFINNQSVVYLDSSSTSLKPNSVLKDVNDYYQKYPFNIGRGTSKFTQEVNKKVDETRELVRKFINASSTDEVVFTNGATEASNLLSYSYGLPNLKNNDEVLVCNEDHKSTVLPWIHIQDILDKLGLTIQLVNILIDFEGDYKERDLIDKVNERTKVVVLTHIHNMYGLEMDIENLVSSIRQKNKGCKIILDASQSIGHIKVDVQRLNVDFLYFSGHKMFALPGSGVLYIRKDNYQYLTPFRIGGGYQNQSVPNYNNFECGTLNIPGILSLGSAIKYINRITVGEIEKYVYSLTRYLYNELVQIKQIEFNKGIAKCKCALGYGIISFKIQGILPTDVIEVLNEYNIIVRGGNFCNTSNTDDFIRVSLHIYNHKEDIDKLVKVLKYIVEESLY